MSRDPTANLSLKLRRLQLGRTKGRIWRTVKL